MWTRLYFICPAPRGKFQTKWSSDLYYTFIFIVLIQPMYQGSRIKPYLGEQGWRSGESTRLPPMWPRFVSRTPCHMWVVFVVDSRLCSERFFSGHYGFPLSSKTNISKFQIGLESEGHRFVSRNRLLSITLVKQSWLIDLLTWAISAANFNLPPSPMGLSKLAWQTNSSTILHTIPSNLKPPKERVR